MSRYAQAEGSIRVQIRFVERMPERGNRRGDERTLLHMCLACPQFASRRGVWVVLKGDTIWGYSIEKILAFKAIIFTVSVSTLRRKVRATPTRQ